MPTWNDPSPLVNPFTAGRRRMSFSRGPGGDPRGLAVPNQDQPMYGTPEWEERSASARGLTVPNQDVPPGDRLSGAGFLPGSDRLFRLPDGTVMDWRSGRVLAAPRSAPGCWGDPRAEVPCPFRSAGDWGGGPSLEELVRNADLYAGGATPDGDFMDPASARYWLKAEEEAEKLKAAMTPEQKAAIAAFEARFPKSRLIEESAKP